jgi:hypothetical protein
MKLKSKNNTSDNTQSLGNSLTQTKTNKITLIPTTLRFKFMDGKEKIVILPDRPMTYWDLQTAIAHSTPKHRNMFKISDDNNRFVESENFVPCNQFEIREFFSPQTTDLHPLAPIKWEYMNFHGAPPNWIDPQIIREQKRAEDLEKQRIAKEAEEKELQEFLKKKSQLSSILDSFT